ncbi:MAG TPA: VWA domain-containing protein, partial [Polyangiaceae bacterium]
MSIDEADPRLTAHVFGELSNEDQAALEAELAADESARAELAEIQRTVDALRAEFTAPKPLLLEAERRKKIEDLTGAARNQRRRRLLWGATSLAGMAALALLYVTTRAPERKPETLLFRAPSQAEQTMVEPAAPEDTSEVPLVPLASAAEPVAPMMPAPFAPDRVAAPALGRPRSTPVTGAASKPRGPSSRLSRMDNDDRSHPPLQQKRLEPGLLPNVNAGEWDDNANYREFMRWLSTEPAPGAHRIDIRDRRFLVVRDAAGLGVPNCRVLVADENDRQTELVTAATGRTILFPRAEGLAGRTLTATTDCAGGANSRFFLSGPDGVVELRTTERRVLPAEQVIDVAFILDSTGSMSEEIAAVKSTIQKVASGLRNSNVRIRIGLVEFKDRGDPFVTRVFPMSTDLQRFSREVAGV